MSLKRTNLAEAVKNQYSFKLKANIDAFSALILIQVLGIVFSLGGVSGFGMSSENLEVKGNYYSGDVVFAFTLIWMFVSAITVTTKVNRNQDFTFVTNRMSSNLANILFLLTAGLLGSTTAVLAGNLLRVVVYLFIEKYVYLTPYDFQFGTGMIMTFMYLALAGSLGYFFGSLIQTSRLFILLIPILIIGPSILQQFASDGSFVQDIFVFYFKEHRLFLFTLKSIVTALFFYMGASLLLNRLEVKR